MAAHADLAAGLRQLIDTRAEDPMNLPWCSLCRIDIDLNTGRCECDHLGFGMEIVTAVEVDDHQPALAYHPPVEFAELPDTTHTRPPSLVDRYPHGVAERSRAMGRLIGSGLRHHIPLGNPDPWSTR